MPDRAAIRIPGLAIVVLAILIIAAEGQRTLPGDWLWDFGSFLESGRAARDGLNPYGIYPLTFHVVLPGFDAFNPNLNPPISALLFRAFDVAEPHLVFRVWYGISLALYATSVLLLALRYEDRPRLVLAFWAFGLAGLWDTLLLGQIYMPLVLAITVAWLLLERGEGVVSGVLIGLVVAIKPNFAVWPALLLLSAHFRPALVAIATAAVVSAIPLLVLGPEVYRQWLELLASDTGRAIFLTNASLTGLMARIGMQPAGLVLGLAMLGAAALWAWRYRPGVMQASAMALILSLVASPIAWIHYTLFLLPLVFWRWDLNGVRLAALLLLVPTPFLIAQFGKPTWTQITVGSVYNWALLICLAALVRDAVRTAVARKAAAAAPIATPAAAAATPQ